MAPTSPSSVPPSGALLPRRFTALRAQDVVDLHDRLLAEPAWPPAEPVAAGGAASPAGESRGAGTTGEALWHWVKTNHRYNCLLWAEEDLARRTQVQDAEIAANKRAIDRYNQARNDATERVDEILLTLLGLVDAQSAGTDNPVSQAAPGARLNSETAGSMVDRMSILALKVQAMRKQTQREDVDILHRDSSQEKLRRLLQQRSDLAMCLDALLQDTAAGLAYFKVYRQFKMYNDPRFNPALVAEAHAHPGR